MADQTKSATTRVRTVSGLLTSRTVDRPAPEDYFRHFVENSSNARIRGIEDRTSDLDRSLKDLVIQHYFVVR